MNSPVYPPRLFPSNTPGWTEEAQRVFERILALNPNDNRGVRFLWQDVRDGLSWEESVV